MNKNKKISKTFLCLLLALLTLTLTVVPAVAAEGSHGFYVDPVTSDTSKKFDAFMIDFRSDCDNALATYFELAGFSMDTSASVKKLHYLGISGGGGYAGLQVRNSGDERVGIMSLWQYEYTDPKTMKKVILNAEQIYPAGSGTFGNEGSGVNWIKSYQWSDHQWYRMLLYSWTDTETGYTFAGTWFYSYEEDEWFLHVYFDTKLVDSYFKNGFGQFIENWSAGVNRMVRAASYKNFYVIDHESKEWVSLPKLTLSTDSNLACVGTTTMGISEDKTYVWEKVDGTIDDPNFKQLRQTHTITQDDKPSYGTPAIEKLTSNYSKTKGLTVSWQTAKNSTPMLSYKLDVYNKNGELIASKEQTRPEVRLVSFKDIEEQDVKCVLTVKDLFGQETSPLVYTSENYDNPNTDKTEVPDTEASKTTASPEPEVPQTPSSGAQTATGKGDNDSSNATILIAACVAAVLVVVMIAVALIIKKGKKNS